MPLPSSLIRAVARCFALALASVPALALAEISLSVPEDGGTPRDPARIERVAPGEFKIRAAYEDGGRSPLRHAVSRVDLIAHNRGATPQPVTLHLDLSGDGARTSFDDAPHAGMPLRDFIFIQTPGAEWQQMPGKTSGWVATITFAAPPGDTKVGLSPWYTYGDLVKFLGALPKHPHLRKESLGKSDGGRDHWELTITDPEIPADQKTRIYWHAREHAYETFSSFAMEALIEYLLSDDAAPFRRRHVFSLHPMTNVDGVAQGYEYRGGYDFPTPRGTATGRMTFDTMDRLKPHFSVAWHNWIAPRDRDDVSYTDSENGQPSARAWYVFTQRFPSPHSTGHRWRNETNAASFNWGPRRPFNLGNVHQYAMKNHGTALWGWEMPWWNRTPADARQMGVAFARAFLATIEDLRTDRKLPPPETATPQVARWDVHEFVTRGRAHVANPFRAAALVGEFTSPAGKTMVVDGFHDGGDTWRLRFAPTEEGEWSYLLRGEGVEIFQRGRLRCTAPRGHGFLGVHPANPYAFAHTDGTAYFPLGDTAYGLYDDSPITPALREEYLRARRAQRFNFVRMQVRQSRDHGERDPNFWPWGGTPQAPDLDRFNPAYFRGLDEVVARLRAVGMNIELILLNYYRPPMTDVRHWTPAREQLWLRYVLARYSAYAHVFLWTVANEYETHPDGRYRLDLPGDVEWARATARFIKQHDPYRHLVTVHPVISASVRGVSPRSPIDPPWRIGEFFGEGDAVDVLSHQTSAAAEGITWDEQLQCWVGDDPHLVASVRADRRFRKPVVNTENGYEYLRGHPTEKKQVHHTDKVRRAAWRIVSAGGYVAAGFVGTIAHSDNFNYLDAPNRYTFQVKDEGAAAQLGLLHDFFAPLPFWRLAPFTGITGNAVALAEEGKLYVVYLPYGGTIGIDLVAAKSRVNTRWFNPRTGAFQSATQIDGGRTITMAAPDASDWVLLLKTDTP
jgi:hypothetical protein